MESKLLYKTFLVSSSALGLCCWVLPLMGFHVWSCVWWHQYCLRNRGLQKAISTYALCQGKCGVHVGVPSWLEGGVWCWWFLPPYYKNPHLGQFFKTGPVSSCLIALQFHFTFKFTACGELCSFSPFGLVQLSKCTSLPTTGDLFTALRSPVGGHPKHSLFTLCSHIWHPLLPFAMSLLLPCDNAPLHCTILWGSQIRHYIHNNYLLLLSVKKV